MQCGVLAGSSGADGSCSYQQGNTVLVAAVFGPRELAAGVAGGGGGVDDSGSDCRVSVQLAAAPFSGSARRERRRSDKRMAEMGAVVRQSVAAAVLTHLFPSSSLLIGLTVLQDDGGLLPAALNAATLALLHAGIPMRDVPVAVSVACAPSPLSGQQQQHQPAVGRAQTAHADSPAVLAASAPPAALSASSSSSVSPLIVLLDPSVAEVSAVGAQSGCVLQLGFGSCSERVSFLLSSGRLPVAELGAMLSASQAACRAIHQRMKDEMSRCSQSSGSLQPTKMFTSLPVAAG